MVDEFQRAYPHQVRLAFPHGWRGKHVTHALHYRRAFYDYRWWTDGPFNVWGFKEIEDVVAFELWATSCGIDWDVPPEDQANDFGEPPEIYVAPNPTPESRRTPGMG
jgi:hypothetical protein